MIDLSNNNSTVDFHTVRKYGQYRVYLKRSEGGKFADPLYNERYNAARAAGMRVGAYHYARPSVNSPETEALFFARLLGALEPGFSLVPALDLEDPEIRPGRDLAVWAARFGRLVYEYVKYRTVLYGYYSYLESCQFTPEEATIFDGLWIAAYGRNDGREYPFGIPQPWKLADVQSQQISDMAHVPGVGGYVDLSVVFRGGLDVQPTHRITHNRIPSELFDWQ